MNSDPRLTVVADYAALSRAAADRVAAEVAQHPNGAITVPTGGTPIGMYQELVDRVHRGALNLSRIHIYCLDEYLGVSAEDPNSLTGWLERVFLAPAGIPAAHVHAVPAAASDPKTAAHDYEAELSARGGLDLAVLGLGPNGHIAYNEPGSAAGSRTRVLDLTPESVAQAAGYWQESVPIPNQAMTLGVGTILEARRIALLVSGEEKAEMLRRALRDPMSPAVPASWLRLGAERLEVIADEGAASKL